jgi:phosphatidylglycerophosphate synthase
MLVAKQVADFITLARALVALVLIWLGSTYGSAALPVAVYLMLIDWTGDSMDGAIARRSRFFYHTWIGEHDLFVDMLVSLGLMVYMLVSGFLPLSYVVVYILFWLLLFWRFGSNRELGMLFQAPIYGWFIWVAFCESPPLGWLMVLWCVVAMIVTWPRFPRMVVPDFLDGMREILRKFRNPGDE